MSTAILTENTAQSDFDVVGQYDQDAINGFSPELVEGMLSQVEPFEKAEVMDAMAGDGNLTKRLFRYCRKTGVGEPKVMVLEYSQVQAERAKHELKEYPVVVMRGDVLDMKNDQSVPKNHFDRVMIKSGNHEIPMRSQGLMHQNIHDVLKPGARFVNLGFLFEHEEERDEIRDITKIKDSLAGLQYAANNRHFLTRNEYYGVLREAGFVDIRMAKSLDYRIQSRLIAKYYLKARRDLERFLEAGRGAQALRRAGRIIFDNSGENVMILPGEITVARRPTFVEDNMSVFRAYPMDLLRKVRVHSELLDHAEAHVSKKSKVLDLGCGIGLLAERLVMRDISYEGLDLSEEMILSCRERFAGAAGFKFSVSDMNTSDLPENCYDRVFLLNVLHLSGIQPVQLIRKALAALRPGGKLLVSGPVSRDSFTLVEPLILDGLAQESVSVDSPEVQALREANHRLLTQFGNYWSAEGMAELLLTLGFENIEAVHTNLYHGFAYLAVARKGAI